jgi:uncharacterized protein with HEPN domain
MSKHDDRISLRQMLDYAQRAQAMMAGRQRADLDSDVVLQLALTRAVEVIGEAASRVSEPYRSKHPEIPWRDIVGMRNRLIHGYDTVDVNLLWGTVATELPPLIVTLERILQEEK